jgi:hypothetical protein
MGISVLAEALPPGWREFYDTYLGPKGSYSIRLAPYNQIIPTQLILITPRT